jgi:hypothetical protein
VNEEIRFGEEESSLIADKIFFEQKQKVSKKIRTAFSQIRDELRNSMTPERYMAPEDVDFTQGKLSGGEKHYDLPYIYLDFPRRFTKEYIFAYRSLFWWGHHFLFTLILAGDLLPNYQKRVLSGWDRLAARGDYIAVTDDPWEWRKDEEFFRLVQSADTESLEKTILELPFLKLIHFIPFDDQRLEEGLLVNIGVDTFRDWEFVILS